MNIKILQNLIAGKKKVIEPIAPDSIPNLKFWCSSSEPGYFSQSTGNAIVDLTDKSSAHNNMWQNIHEARLIYLYNVPASKNNVSSYDDMLRNAYQTYSTIAHYVNFIHMFFVVKVAGVGESYPGFFYISQASDMNAKIVAGLVNNGGLKPTIFSKRNDSQSISTNQSTSNMQADTFVLLDYLIDFENRNVSIRLNEQEILNETPQTWLAGKSEGTDAYQVRLNYNVRAKYGDALVYSGNLKMSAMQRRGLSLYLKNFWSLVY